jgi:hypothetical protein
MSCPSIVRSLGSEQPHAFSHPRERTWPVLCVWRGENEMLKESKWEGFIVTLPLYSTPLDVRFALGCLDWHFLTQNRPKLPFLERFERGKKVVKMGTVCVWRSMHIYKATVRYLESEQLIRVHLPRSERCKFQIFHGGWLCLYVVQTVTYFTRSLSSRQVVFAP